MLLRPGRKVIIKRLVVRSYIAVEDFFEDDDEQLDTIHPKGKNNLPVAVLTKGKFISPFKRTKKSIGNVLGWLITKEIKPIEIPNTRNSYEVIPSLLADCSALKSALKLHVTWLGHATCFFQSAGLHFLTDPVFSKRTSPSQWMGPKRGIYSPLQYSELPKVDVVLLSHTHYDHLDAASAKAIGNSAKWIVPLGVKKLLETSFGITNVVELNWWDKHIIRSKNSGGDGDVEVIFTPTQHWTSRTPWDRNTCLWGSFVVCSKQGKFFFGGDSAYCSVFKTIGDLYGPFDLSALSIGAYKPRWFMKDVHCNPAEAMQIHKDLKSKQSIGIHWGTFPLADEDYIEPALELARVRTENAEQELSNDADGSSSAESSAGYASKSKDFFTLALGETFCAGDDRSQFDMATFRPDVFRYYSDNFSMLFEDKETVPPSAREIVNSLFPFTAKSKG